ncbi:MAG: choice-of-anchor D domain-containing protein, partial [Gemmatimonadota bacterium]
ALRLEPGARQDLPVAFTPRRDGPVAARLLIHSSDLAPPVVALPVSGAGLAPELALSPLPEVGLDFGPVEVGQNRVERLTVLNRGRADLHVRLLEVTGGGFSMAAADSLPAIPPGSRSAVSVTFAPRYEGAVQGAALLSSDDPDRPEVSVPLQGLARISPARVEVISPATIAFGSVPIGKTAHQQLLLWNRGGSPFTAGLRLTGGQGEFELAAEAMLLQPGQSGKVELAFSPKEVGGRAAALQVATEGGVAEYRLEGTGKYLQLSPAVWDFGRVPVGESGSAVIELANTGNADFTVSRISTSNDDYAVHTQVSADSEYLLPANSRRSLPVTVTFAPAARGLSTGALRAEGFWEEGTETFDVLLNGTGVAAEVELHPSGSIDFGYVVLGQTQVSTLVATNTGDTALRVETNPLTREARVEPAAFSLDPGESTQLQVYFTPAALGERFGQILLVSNDVRDKAQPIKIVGKGALESIDLTRITRVQVSRKSVTAPLAVSWNNNPAVLHDGTKIDLVFDLPDSLRQALVGRRISIEWVQLDENYDPKGGSTQSEVQIYGDTEGSVLAETLNLRLKESDVRRVRLRVTTRSYPDAPPQTISQVFEAGGWKWEFEAKPLVSFLTVRPGRTYTDGTGQRVQGKAERLIGLPGLAFVGWHNSEGPSISGLHLTAIGNVLEALSTENAIAVSLGLAVSLYKDRFLIGFGYDIYDSRPRAKRQGTEDYIFTFKYSGLFR